MIPSSCLQKLVLNKTPRTLREGGSPSDATKVTNVQHRPHAWQLTFFLKSQPGVPGCRLEAQEAMNQFSHQAWGFPGSDRGVQRPTGAKQNPEKFKAPWAANHVWTVVDRGVLQLGTSNRGWKAANGESRSCSPPPPHPALVSWSCTPAPRTSSLPKRQGSPRAQFSQ